MVAPAASAHPDLLSTSPGQGTQVASAPRQIEFRLSDTGQVSGPGGFLFDSKGTKLAATAAMSRDRETAIVTPKSRLRPGPYEAIVQIRSDEDGHVVQYPTVFCVGGCMSHGAKVTLPTDSGAKVTMDGTDPGLHTIRIATRSRKGTVSFMSEQAPVPVLWKVKGDGRFATARVILPYSSTWTAIFDLAGGGSTGGLHVATID